MQRARQPFPGDAFIPSPIWEWTHGVEIDAPAAEVWPWVAQLGSDSRSRFISRWRISFDEASWKLRLMYGPTFVEPIGFVMDRKMLLGVKARAERALLPQPARPGLLPAFAH